MTKVAAAALFCLVTLAAQSPSGGIPGDPAAGKAVLEGKGGCLQCHSIQNQGGYNQGGSLGPDLSEVGVRRTPESLRLAITDPDAEIHPEYLTIVVVTSGGGEIRGIRLNEDDISVQLRDADGNLRSFLKDHLKDFGRELRSLMPSYASKLSAAEIDNLVAYLRTLKRALGEPARAVRRARTIAQVSENIGWLTRPDRDADERPETLLDALQIPEGAAVADLGAGTGYFTRRLARRVGSKGRVIAVEIQQRMLDRIAEDLKNHNITNVELVLGGERDPRLPERALDLVLIANAYHEFSEPESILAAVRRSLKPLGRVVVLEYRKEDAYTPLEPLHKMTLQELRSEIEPLGFELDRLLDFLPLQHALVLTVSPP